MELVRVRFRLAVFCTLIGVATRVIGQEAEGAQRVARRLPPQVQNEVGFWLLVIVFLGLVMIAVVIGGERYFRLAARRSPSKSGLADDAWYQKPLIAPPNDADPEDRDL